MNPNKPVYHMALVTLEAKTAHGIHSGNDDAVHDVVLQRDANGLPALPGSSLAGVLRHLYTEEFGERAAKATFGTVDDGDAQNSALTVGWGLAHDSHNGVKEGLRNDIGSDKVLSALEQEHPLTRHRVSLDARGTAIDTGKFDVSLVPAGVRYSSLLGFWSDGSEADETAWRDLLGLFYHPAFRLGHSTRNGAGAFIVESLRGESWDLRTPEGREGFIQRPRTRQEARPLPPIQIAPDKSTSFSVTLSLKSEAGWRIGGDPPDMLPQSEWRIVWQENGQADIGQRQYLVPASAIKGALRHRFAFHHRCLSADWVGQNAKNSPQPPHENTAVNALFGHASDSAPEQDQTGQAGLLLIDDIHIPQQNATTHRQMHNRIDQFTGGVMSGALFEEGLLWKTPLELTLHLHGGKRLAALDKHAREALQRTLEDLCQGRLPLGAGGSRGQGAFTATDDQSPHWSDGGDWVNQEETPA